MIKKLLILIIKTSSFQKWRFQIGKGGPTPKLNSLKLTARALLFFLLLHLFHCFRLLISFYFSNPKVGSNKKEYRKRTNGDCENQFRFKTIIWVRKSVSFHEHHHSRVKILKLIMLLRRTCWNSIIQVCFHI